MEVFLLLGVLVGLLFEVEGNSLVGIYYRVGMLDAKGGVCIRSGRFGFARPVFEELYSY